MELDKYDLALTNFAASEDSRPVLNTICLRDGKWIAADGYLMVQRDADFNKDETKPTTDILLPVPMLKRIKLSSRTHAKVSINGKVSIKYTDEFGKPKQYEPEISFATANSGNFPKIDQLFPSEKKISQVALSASLLKKLVAILPNDAIVRIGIIDDKSPVEFKVNNMDRPLQGLLMPMYIDWSEPTWVRPEKKPTESKS